jgi:hypothetical protein
MPRTTRKMICDRADSAISGIDYLDVCLMDIDQLAAGRQPAIDLYRLPLLEMHNLLRAQWKAFRKLL